MNKARRATLQRIADTLHKRHELAESAAATVVDLTANDAVGWITAEGIQAAEAALDKLHDLDIEGLRDEVSEVADEEQEAMDNLPESLQGAGPGERIQEALDNLESADGSFDEALSALTEATEAWEVLTKTLAKLPRTVEGHLDVASLSETQRTDVRTEFVDIGASLTNLAAMVQEAIDGIEQARDV